MYLVATDAWNSLSTFGIIFIGCIVVARLYKSLHNLSNEMVWRHYRPDLFVVLSSSALAKPNIITSQSWEVPQRNRLTQSTEYNNSVELKILTIRKCTTCPFLWRVWSPWEHVINARFLVNTKFEERSLKPGEYVPLFSTVLPWRCQAL